MGDSGCLMVSVLSSDQAVRGSIPGRGRCVVFLGKLKLLLCLSLPRSKWVPANC